MPSIWRCSSFCSRRSTSNPALAPPAPVFSRSIRSLPRMISARWTIRSPAAGCHCKLTVPACPSISALAMRVAVSVYCHTVPPSSRCWLSSTISTGESGVTLAGSTAGAGFTQAGTGWYRTLSAACAAQLVDPNSATSASRRIFIIIPPAIPKADDVTPHAVRAEPVEARPSPSMTLAATRPSTGSGRTGQAITPGCPPPPISISLATRDAAATQKRW